MYYKKLKTNLFQKNLKIKLFEGKNINTKNKTFFNNYQTHTSLKPYDDIGSRKFGAHFKMLFKC